MKKERSVWFVDVMLGECYQFTMRYEHCPAFKFDIEDVYKKVIKKRPSLEHEKNLEIYIY